MKSITKKRKIIVIVSSIILVVAFVAAFFILRNDKNDELSAKNDPTTTSSKDTKDQSVVNTDNPATTTQSSTQTSNGFTISGVNIHDPEVVYNNDKIGTPNKACRVKADISVSAAGTVNYYWDTYHPQYYNPSNKGPDESITFDQKGTKTISLETYISNDARRFTLYITSPGNISKPTATQVWCPTS